MKNVEFHCDRPVSNSKEGQERFDRSLDQIDKLQKLWDERLTLEESLAEYYVKGKLRILVLWRSVSSTDGDQRLAVFQRAASGLSASEQAIAGDRLEGDDSGNDHLRHLGSGCYEKPVFIRDVEHVKSPEYISLPSLVRFYLLDEVDRAGIGTLYFSQVSGGFKFLNAMSNRECRLIGDLAAHGIDKLTGEVIKTRPQAMNGVSQDREKRRWWLIDDAELNHALTGFEVVISDCAIGIGLKEGFNRKIKIEDVLFGPFDLGPNADQPFLARHPSPSKSR